MFSDWHEEQERAEYLRGYLEGVDSYNDEKEAKIRELEKEIERLKKIIDYKTIDKF